MVKKNYHYSKTPSSQKVNVNRVLTAGSNFGKSIMIITSVIFGIIGIVLLFFSIKKLITPDKQKNIVDAIVSEASCLSYNTYSRYSTKNHVSCTLKVKYIVNNKEIENVINTLGKYSYIVGQKIKVEYEEENPSNVNICCSASHLTKGAWTLFLSFICILISIFNWYYRNNSYVTLGRATDFIF